MDEQHVSEGQIARRRFLKQAGAIAWASPVIVTMMGRAAHAQATTCGIQDFTLEGGAPLIFCANTTPCGTAQSCIPDPDNFGPGNPCVCASGG